MSKFIPIAVVFALLLKVAVTPSTADESFEPLSGVTVYDAVVDSAPTGATSRLQMKIENLSSEDITLIGVRSSIAASGALVVVGGPEPDAETSLVLLIRQEETLDLQSSHIRLELRGLKSPLTKGDSAPFELVFRRGVALGMAHVHSRRN